MRSPRERLLDGIERWQLELARERVASWRGDPDAVDEGSVHARHARLRSAQAQELLGEAVDRGDVDDADRALLEGWLAAAQEAPALAALAQIERAAWGARVPYDSDHFAAEALLPRLERDPSERRRRALGRAIEPTLAEVGARRRELRAERPASVDAERETERARAVLDATEDAWVEVWHRTAHAAGQSPRAWTDLAFVLRAPRWDDAVKPGSRWRRLAGTLEALAFTDRLRSAVRVERRRAAPHERSARLAIVDAPRDVRIGPGFERGVASEREAARALGRALAVALIHPATPPHRARLGSGRGVLGALLAHVLAAPEHLGRAHDLAARERRELGELLVAHELVGLRTAAARALLAPHLAEPGLAERAIETLRTAWAIDEVPDGLGVLVAAGPEPGPDSGLAAAEAAPRLFVALRERFDADFWRNPAAAEEVGAAAAAGPDVAGWLEALGATEVELTPRYEELL